MKLTAGSLVVQRHTQQIFDMVEGGGYQWDIHNSPIRRFTDVSYLFTKHGGTMGHPVEGCRGRAAMRTDQRVKLLERKARDTIVIL